MTNIKIDHGIIFLEEDCGSLYRDHKCTTFNLSDSNNSTSTYTDKKLSPTCYNDFGDISAAYVNNKIQGKYHYKVVKQEKNRSQRS